MQLFSLAYRTVNSILIYLSEWKFDKLNRRIRNSSHSEEGHTSAFSNDKARIRFSKWFKVIQKLSRVWSKSGTRLIYVWSRKNVWNSNLSPTLLTVECSLHWTLCIRGFANFGSSNRLAVIRPSHCDGWKASTFFCALSWSRIIWHIQTFLDSKICGLIRRIIMIVRQLVS